MHGAHAERLNAKTISDQYPIPHIKNFGQTQETIFTTLDLRYNQILALQEDIPKTAIKTPFGLFEFLYMPFELTPPQTFQRFINEVLHRLNFCY